MDLRTEVTCNSDENYVYESKVNLNLTIVKLYETEKKKDYGSYVVLLFQASGDSKLTKRLLTNVQQRHREITHLRVHEMTVLTLFLMI